MCRMGTTRLYHATAALLPDARVVVAGHDGFLNAPPFTTSEYRLEIFSPPYLFRGPRPAILQAPASLAYNQRVFVRTDEAADIASAALLRHSSVTHQTNTDQRYVGLDFQTASNGLWLTAPPNGGVAPPGFYMLFLVNTAGVPSIARSIRVG
jgi:galactose oxidase